MENADELMGAHIEVLEGMLAHKRELVQELADVVLKQIDTLPLDTITEAVDGMTRFRGRPYMRFAGFPRINHIEYEEHDEEINEIASRVELHPSYVSDLLKERGRGDEHRETSTRREVSLRALSYRAGRRAIEEGDANGVRAIVEGRRKYQFNLDPDGDEALENAMIEFLSGTNTHQNRGESRTAYLQRLRSTLPEFELVEKLYEKGESPLTERSPNEEIGADITARCEALQRYGEELVDKVGEIQETWVHGVGIYHLTDPASAEPLAALIDLVPGTHMGGHHVRYNYRLRQHHMKRDAQAGHG